MKKILSPEFIEKIEEFYSKDELKTIEEGFKTEKRKPSFRINTLKANEEKTIDSLKEAGVKIEKVEYLNNVYNLSEGREKDLWDTGAFKAGYIYMQGISSMIPVLLFNFEEKNKYTKILDVTAAPGSKTSQISALIENEGQIIACDNNQIRIDKLNFTLKRQGVKNVGVVKTDARKLSEKLKKEFGAEIEEYFDKILFDAPCSAEGRFNLNIEKSYAFWNSSIPKKNYRLQKDILTDIVKMLKIGGELVYSTCTLSVEENEKIVHYIQSMFPNMEIVDISESEIFKNMKSKKGITTLGKSMFKNADKSIRILPTAEYEGFFVAKFVKK
ncbi:MAG: RsmB/NOP family class I SAM-dependent RNA methyltransferase [Candidatus Gracilibacteria bacterium]|nr:RsmB/NOP family class I SAM-dependent RNA methyltransferase [Candidatus Gracilibacteria bacterium]MDQ7022403.1 RsmB/NOP family class I SAM-dependent RNA methyltransferase [Candidatus Gracilibacteria bacterium]